MKLSKDRIQKFFLLGMLGAGALYFYSFELLAPLAEKEKKIGKEITDIESKIKEANSKIARKNAIETGDPNGPAAQQILKIMQARIPNGSPVAWFSTRLMTYFKQQNIAVRVGRTFPDQSGLEIPGYIPFSCSMDINGTNFGGLGTALAGLENQEGLAEITFLQIDGDPKDPGKISAQITISTLARH